MESILYNVHDGLKEDPSWPVLRQFLDSSLRLSDDKGFYWAFDLENIFLNKDAFRSFGIPLHAQGNSFSSPSLFLKGDNSQYVRTRHIATIADLYPNYTLVSVMKAGHWVHHDQRMQVAEFLAQFLQSV